MLIRSELAKRNWLSRFFPNAQIWRPELFVILVIHAGEILQLDLQQQRKPYKLRSIRSTTTNTRQSAAVSCTGVVEKGLTRV